MSYSIGTYNGNWATFNGAVGIFEIPYEPTLPYLVFRFDDPDYNPSGIGPIYSGWTRVSGSTSNDWYWEHDYYSSSATGSSATGWPAAFSSTATIPVGQLTTTCDIVGFGNLTASSRSLVTMDRMFANCSGLRSVVTIQTPNTLEIVGGTFSGCTNIEDGALDQYTYWSTYNTNISNHSGTFSDAGADTTTGLAELNQIPVGWGGNYTPASTLMGSSRARLKNNYDIWWINADYPTWTNVVPNHMNLLTTSSVSAYAGVSMNRSRIYRFGSLDVSTYAELYFYPCFMQHTYSAITWAVVTAHPNGQLASRQSNTDMPGTLDYSTIGPFTYESGSYGNVDVYFCFLVTNSPIDANGWLNVHPYGVLYNSNFKTDAGLRWFF